MATAFKNYNVLIFKLDNQTAAVTDITAYCNNQSIAGSMNLIEGTVMNTKERPQYPGTSGATFSINGFINSTTEAIFAPLVGNRTSLTKTFGFYNGYKYLTGECYPTNVQFSGQPDNLPTWSADFTVDGAITRTATTPS